MFLKITFLIASLVAAASADETKKPKYIVGAAGDCTEEKEYEPLRSWDDCKEAAVSFSFPEYYGKDWWNSVPLYMNGHPQGCIFNNEILKVSFNYGMAGDFGDGSNSGSQIICKLVEPVDPKKCIKWKKDMNKQYRKYNERFIPKLEKMVEDFGVCDNIDRNEFEEKMILFQEVIAFNNQLSYPWNDDKNL